MEKIVTFYNQDTEEVNGLLQEGYTVKNIHSTSHDVSCSAGDTSYSKKEVGNILTVVVLGKACC